jgi:hypothetical protein
MTPLALGTRLAAVDPAAAALGNALIRRFDRRRAGELLVRASRPAGPLPAGWLPVAGDGVALAFAPTLAGGRPVAPTGRSDAPCAMTLLAAFHAMEELLDLVERQIGPLGRAEEARAAPGDAMVAVRLDAATAQGVVAHQLWLAVDGLPGDLLPLPAEPASTAWLAPKAQVPVQWRLRGPSIPVVAAAALEPGDMLLLGTGQPVGILEAAGRQLPVRLEATDRLRIAEEIDIMIGMDAAPTDAVTELPLELCIAAGRITLADAATLRPGQLLPLPLNGATLPVSVEAGGARIASGELVALGEGYGVLLTAVEPA